MLKRALNIFISILILLPIVTGMFSDSGAMNNALPFLHLLQSSFEKPCDMDYCNPLAPKCPLCPSWGSVNSYLLRESGAYLPPLTSSLIAIISSTLSDQGVVKTIFHPPTQLV
jgi:hypothetical protein